MENLDFLYTQFNEGTRSGKIIGILKERLEKDPNKGYLLYNLFLCNLKENNFEESWEYFERLYKEAPQDKTLNIILLLLDRLLSIPLEYQDIIKNMDINSLDKAPFENNPEVKDEYDQFIRGVYYNASYAILSEHLKNIMNSTEANCLHVMDTLLAKSLAEKTEFYKKMHEYIDNGKYEDAIIYLEAFNASNINENRLYSEYNITKALLEDIINAQNGIIKPRKTSKEFLSIEALIASGDYETALLPSKDNALIFKLLSKMCDIRNSHEKINAPKATKIVEDQIEANRLFNDGYYEEAMEYFENNIRFFPSGELYKLLICYAYTFNIEKFDILINTIISNIDKVDRTCTAKLIHIIEFLYGYGNYNQLIRLYELLQKNNTKIPTRDLLKIAYAAEATGNIVLASAITTQVQSARVIQAQTEDHEINEKENNENLDNVLLYYQNLMNTPEKTESPYLQSMLNEILNNHKHPVEVIESSSLEQAEKEQVTIELIAALRQNRIWSYTNDLLNYYSEMNFIKNSRS